jgi:hypothetical protein
MRARAGSIVTFTVLAAATAYADPNPKAVDIKAIRDQLVVLADGDGGIYVALPGRAGRLWYGSAKSKKLYEQIVTGRSTDDKVGRWDVSVWAPRVPNLQPGSVGRDQDGVYYRYCGGDKKVPLTPVTGDKATTVLDKSSFLSTAMIRRPHMLARDDAGVYYYVDVIRNEYGGKGFRVFVGKKGAMKQRPLTDVASDTAGDVFATKTGDLRIVRDTTSDKHTITWVKGEKRTQLFWLDTDMNSVLIFKDLGIYTFTGSICENY